METKQLNICGVCGKDHSKKNTGPLTQCELESYLKNGSVSPHRAGGKKVHTFGAGVRFQLNTAK